MVFRIVFRWFFLSSLGSSNNIQVRCHHQSLSHFRFVSFPLPTTVSCWWNSIFKPTRKRASLTTRSEVVQVAPDIWFNFILCGFPYLCRRFSSHSTTPTVTKSTRLSWTEHRLFFFTLNDIQLAENNKNEKIETSSRTHLKSSYFLFGSIGMERTARNWSAAVTYRFRWIILILNLILVRRIQLLQRKKQLFFHTAQDTQTEKPFFFFFKRWSRVTKDAHWKQLNEMKPKKKATTRKHVYF